VSSFSVLNSARDGSTTTAGRRPVTVHFRGTIFETLRATDGNQPRVFVCGTHQLYSPNALLLCYVVVAIPTIGSLWRTVRTRNWPGWNPEPSSDQYEWATVTSATPTATGKSLNGTTTTTTTTCYSPGGFWYFFSQASATDWYIIARHECHCYQVETGHECVGACQPYGLRLRYRAARLVLGILVL
jgi:hypothetical protein